METNDKLNLNIIPKHDWIKHYKNLWTQPNSSIQEENCLNSSLEETIEETDTCISMDELEQVLKAAKNRKSPGKDNLNVELFKYGGHLLKEKLLDLFNNIWRNHKIPSDWETGVVINIHKKGRKDICDNYRGISLLSTASKLYANILKNKLTPISESFLEEEQCGFRKGRGTIDAIFCLQQIIEKRREFNLPLYLLFIDYEKAYDNLNRDKLWNILWEENIDQHLIKSIQSLYQNSKIQIKLPNAEVLEPIHTNKGVRQGCGLSPLLFNIYINRIIQEWKKVVNNGIQLTRNKSIQTILFADDQVLLASSEDELQIAAYQLYKITNAYGMKISTSKSKAMAMCGKNIKRVKIEIDGKIIEQVSEFTYLGNLFAENKLDLDVKIQKYNRMNGVIRRHFGKQMTINTKLRLHNITSKAALSYGSEIWILNKRNSQKIEVAQMKFLRSLLGITRLDRQRNINIREKLEVPCLTEVIQQYQQQWRNHVQRMGRERLPKLSLHYRPRGHRDQGRPRHRWKDQGHLS